MINNKDILDNEISFLELWRILKTYKAFILIVPVVISLIVWIMTLSMAPTWEATTLIEVAQVGKYVPALKEENSAENNDQTISWIDSPETIISRITHPSFFQAVISSSASKDDLSNEALSGHSISASRVKNTAIVKLEVKTASEQSSKELTQSVILKLQNMQKEQLDSATNFLREKIKQNEADLQEINGELGNTKANKSSADFYVRSMLKEKRYLEGMNYILKEQLSATNTHPSRILDETYISSSSVRLKHLIVAAMAFLVAAFFTIVASLVHHTLKK